MNSSVEEPPLNFLVPTGSVSLAATTPDRHIDINDRLGRLEQTGGGGAITSMSRVEVDQSHLYCGRDCRYDEVGIPHEVTPVGEENEVLYSSIGLKEGTGD